MRRCFFFGGEKASALEYHINAQLTPWNLRRIALGKHSNLVAVDDHVITVDCHSAGKLAVGGVVARQVRVGLWLTEIVDRNNLNIIFLTAFVVCAQYVAADSTVTVDGNLDGHGVLLSTIVINRVWSD